MSENSALKRNMAWNTAGLGVEMASGFLLMPFLIATLGTSAYGVWLVLGALTSYFGLLELGVRGSIGRHIALYYSKNDQNSVNQTLTVGVGVLALVGSLAFFILIVCEPIFIRFYEIPDAQRPNVSLTFHLVAISFVVTLISVAFDATLWGFQRFDWLNVIDIPIALSRIGLIVCLVKSSADLPVLAAITLGLSATTGICKAALCFRANPQLRLGRQHFRRSALRQLLGYGSWNAISTFARLSRTQFGTILIGALFGLALVPIFAVANRLLTAVGATLGAVTGVLTPHATALHAKNQTAHQRHLFFVGGRHAATLGSFLLAFLLVAGPSLIALWVGPNFTDAATLLLILVLGEWLPATQQVTTGIILATARHRALALFATGEAVAVCVLMVIFLPLLGISGAGLAVAIPAFLARGVAPMVHGCRTLGVSPWEYLLRSIVPPAICAALPALAIRIASASYPIDNWTSLLIHLGAYSLLFTISYLCILNRRWLATIASRLWLLDGAPPLLSSAPQDAAGRAEPLNATELTPR